MKNINVKSSPEYEKTNESNILPRVAKGEKQAIGECVEKYGTLVWTLAKEFTGSKEEAEAATLEIFRRLWKCAANFNETDCEEIIFIHLLIRRTLLKNN